MLWEKLKATAKTGVSGRRSTPPKTWPHSPWSRWSAV